MFNCLLQKIIKKNIPGVDLGRMMTFQLASAIQYSITTNQVGEGECIIILFSKIYYLPSLDSKNNYS